MLRLLRTYSMTLWLRRIPMCPLFKKSIYPVLTMWAVCTLYKEQQCDNLAVETEKAGVSDFTSQSNSFWSFLPLVEGWSHR